MADQLIPPPPRALQAYGGRVRRREHHVLAKRRRLRLLLRHHPTHVHAPNSSMTTFNPSFQTCRTRAPSKIGSYDNAARISGAGSDLRAPYLRSAAINSHSRQMHFCDPTRFHGGLERLTTDSLPGRLLAGRPIGVRFEARPPGITHGLGDPAGACRHQPDRFRILYCFRGGAQNF